MEFLFFFYFERDSGAIHFKGPTVDRVWFDSSPSSIWRLIPKSLIFGDKVSLYFIIIHFKFHFKIGYINNKKKIKFCIWEYFFFVIIIWDYVNKTFLAAKSLWTIPAQLIWNIPIEIPIWVWEEKKFKLNQTKSK